VRDVKPIGVGTRTVTARLAASLLIVAAAAACGGSTISEPTAARPGVETASPGAASALPASTAGPGAPRDLEALAASFAPPTGEERPSTANDGTLITRWITTESIEALEAHYERLADEADFVLVGTSVGTITTWILRSIDDSVNGSIQVAPEPGAGLVVTVTLTLAQ
jgi:hypothetical protein